ncbi:MAG TPA: nucleotidyltransferase domain-containing protein [Verrucomicrobiales bacterium]|nr:nucleotidyltransferase domain-containing protein [Verrucomicrobiales bacterium]
MAMTLTEVRSPRCCLMEVVSGSRAYGTHTPESDTDLKGVFVQPLDGIMGLHREEQINNETNDIVFYELGRFAELLAKNNPNLLEMLFTPPDCIVLRDPLMDHFTAEMVLSKLCYESFAGYAATQIRKARGLNKKIVNPQPEERKTILDFCYVPEGQGSVPLMQWLERRGLRQHDCGLTAVPHTRDGHALFHGPPGMYGGIWSGPDCTDVILSSVPRDAVPLTWMTFNKDGYKKHCKDWREYQEWLSSRNESRYQGTLAHGQGYDAKNMMHTFRLLDLAEEIAVHRRLTIRTPNREWLLKVKAGAFSYDELLTRAEDQLTRIRDLYAASTLPDVPDRDAIEQAVVSVRRGWYAQTGQS